MRDDDTPPRMIDDFIKLGYYKWQISEETDKEIFAYVGFDASKPFDYSYDGYSLDAYQFCKRNQNMVLSVGTFSMSKSALLKISVGGARDLEYVMEYLANKLPSHYIKKGKEWYTIDIQLYEPIDLHKLFPLDNKALIVPLSNEVISRLNKFLCSLEFSVKREVKPIQSQILKALRKKGFNSDTIESQLPQEKYPDCYDPITMQFMVKPVILGNTGHTFDEVSIQAALKENPGVDPLINSEIPNVSLTPNYALIGMICSLIGGVTKAQDIKASDGSRCSNSKYSSLNQKQESRPDKPEIKYSQARAQEIAYKKSEYKNKKEFNDHKEEKKAQWPECKTSRASANRNVSTRDISNLNRNDPSNLLRDFTKIYIAMRNAQSGLKTNFLNRLAKHGGNTVEKIRFIKAHVRQNPNNRSAKSLTLANQYKNEVNAENTALFKEIYQYGFANSYWSLFGVSRISTNGAAFFNCTVRKNLESLNNFNFIHEGTRRGRIYSALGLC